jgi:hypothetical protein
MQAKIAEASGSAVARDAPRDPLGCLRAIFALWRSFLNLLLVIVIPISVFVVIDLYQ